MLAGVDYVLVGAGNPAEMPGAAARPGPPRRRRARRPRPGGDLRRRRHLGALQPAAAARRRGCRRCPAAGSWPSSPRTTWPPTWPPDPRPARTASSSRAPAPAGTTRRRAGRVASTTLGQPVYDARDQVDLASIAGLGLPFWLAGSYGTPQGLRLALAAGAAGVQVGTAFAFSAESGLADPLKRQVLAQVAAGDVQVVADWRVSPTGFPFKVVQAPGTLSDPEVFARRQPVCDLGALRTPYRKPDGTIGYRCPAEPTRIYVEHKGGRAANTEGRRCVCNALLATAGLPQRRPHGQVEPPLITAGNDFTAVATLMAELPAGQEFYPARAVIDYLRGVTHDSGIGRDPVPCRSGRQSPGLTKPA